MESFEDEYNYMSQTNVYHKAIIYPDSVISESQIDSFMNANANTSIGLFRAISNLSDTLFSLDSLSKATIKNTDSLIVITLKRLANNDSLLYSGVSVNDSLSLLDSNVSLKGSLIDLVQSTHELFAAIDSLVIIDSDSLINENDDVSTSMTIEENQKTINDIYYNTITKGVYTFDSAQTALIYAIALQCPLSGGYSVYVARGLYRLVVDTAYFVDDSTCTDVSPRFAEDEKGEMGFSFIYPNPASNLVMLKYILPKDDIADFIIYDYIGHEILRFKISSTNQEVKFSLQNFCNGLYFYKISSKNNPESFGKFNVIK